MTELKLDKNRYRVKSCPCGKSNKDGKFVPYVGYENEGYCHSCGKTFLPKQDGKHGTGTGWKPPTENRKPLTCLSPKLLAASLRSYDQNHFAQYLKTLFGADMAHWLLGLYNIGTSKHWPGATAFWQVDFYGNIRQCKVMAYDPETGRRVKDSEGRGKVYFAGKALAGEEANLQQCLFGEHLLAKHPGATVYVVESEKTAVLLAGLRSEQTAGGREVYVARGGKNGCKVANQGCLKGRNVVLYPDLGAYDEWQGYCHELNTLIKATCKISDILERNVAQGEARQGYDLADYLTKRPQAGFCERHGYPVTWDWTPPRLADDALHSVMMWHLSNASFVGAIPDTFAKFISGKGWDVAAHFSVDHFSGRVHTPITRLPKEHRNGLRLYGERLVLLDIRQSQPMILGKVLAERVGANEFSQWMESGVDVYEMMQVRGGLASRSEAKDLFYQIAFGKPNGSLEKTFGKADWVEWINDYKTQPNPERQGIEPYKNLVWLLQTVEGVVMNLVWVRLASANIPFLTIHDAVLIPTPQAQQAQAIFEGVLSEMFHRYGISTEQL